MDDSLLTPSGPSRLAQVQDAKDMFDTVKRNAEKSNSSIPPYEFIELIGKGAFGRVYKCRHSQTGQLVAVKILNIDDADFEADKRERDETVKDFRKEVEILTQLKDFKAKNVNMIHDAFDLHSQLWIVSDFCTGGSVRTLMRANPKRGLEEQYLIPIARELAIALKSVHDIGVIHRDLKCANVYVTEDGRIQLGDFGVVGIMDNGIAKRTTIIGTPWYMPREMHIDAHTVTQGYGKEVDIWAYGCTIFEMATGLAPNATVGQNMLGVVLEQGAPRLTGDEYSDDLRDFAAFCLDSNPVTRPTADQILKHPYIAGTRQSHPTHSLVALIDRYVVWEHRGGQRTSLFNPGGAAAPVRVNDEDTPTTESDDWNFNTTESFYGGFAKRYSQTLVHEDFDMHFEAPPGAGLPPIRAKALTPAEQIQREHAAKSENRGAQSLNRIWNQTGPQYDADSHTGTFEPANDLPLREYSSDSAPRESTVFIDLDATPSENTGSAFNFDFDNIQTIKAKQRGSVAEEDEQPVYNNQPTDDKRSTMAWTFPSVAVEETQQKRATMDWTWPGEPMNAHLDVDGPLTLLNDNDDLPTRPQLKHTATAPLGQVGDFIHTGPAYATHAPPTRESLRSLIDLNLDLSDTSDVARPSTAVSYAGSASTIMTAGPFDLDDSSSIQDTDQNRTSFHKPWLSEGGNDDRNSLRKLPLHDRGNSLSSTDSDSVAHGRKDFYNDEYVSDVEFDNYFDKMAGSMMSQTAASENGSTWDTADDDEVEYNAPVTPQLRDFTFPPTSGGVVGAPRQARRQNSDGAAQDPIEFPIPQPPNPEALFDRADEQLVVAELSRLLRDAGNAFKSTAAAVQKYAELDVEDSQINGLGHASNVQYINGA
ncbi:hypothetical protein AMS68_001266 [Peltaster fructicola]|uniref:non-specific serine/threonine protein kinase n=1 Tax=Peltaster fructicola TaxID=286661 RepID=A0A6H0XM96_9PEZI|nr:hypothetical protein AMS68_001266 [Peltaster fructicola]